MPASSPRIDTRLTSRLTKLVMVGCLGLFGLLASFNNITDYNSNFQFVRHVMSMDTTFRGNSLLWRAIPAPWAWHFFYALIILGEMLTGLLFLIATWEMTCALPADEAIFAQAKRFVPLATALGFLIWFFGFSIVGGEWFAMWQSHIWNGQEAAFRFFVTMLLVCLFVKQPE